MPQKRGNRDTSRDQDKLTKSKTYDPLLEIAAEPPASTPETPQQMINSYGTYEIQATADTHNQYPAIAQGYNKKIINRDCENTSVKDRIPNP